MLSGTRIKAPQLDEFFSTAEAPLRASEFAGLGWTEETVWGPNAYLGRLGRIYAIDHALLRALARLGRGI